MPPLPALPVPDGGASAVVDDLARGLEAALGGDLLGLYVHGSLVARDFSPARSDLDLLAVLRTAPDEAALAAVAPVHASLERRHPAWRGRVEVETVGLPTVVAFAGTSGATSGRGDLIMRVSPGEALHLLLATTHRVLTWATVREKGRPLLGAPAAELLPPIAPGAVRTALLEHVRDWPAWVEDMTTVGAQAYAVLSMCRAWGALVEGEQRSKKAAADRFARAHPDDADLVVWARDWWYAGGSDAARSRFGEVRDFVARVSRSLLDGSSRDPDLS